MNRTLYTLLLRLALPLVLLRLLRRGRKQPGYLQHIGERFGFYPPGTGAEPLLWLHAVSVGETRAAAPLVEALLARYPGHRLLLTHMTPTGRETGEALFGDRVLRAYLPYDYPGAVRRFLRHFRPRIGLLMETELWPNLAAVCRREGVPLLLVNARLSEKSAARYARHPALSRECLQHLAAIAAQTPADAERLQALGAAAPFITGNIKFDMLPPVEQLEKGRELRRLFGESRPVFLAASTREGEEALLLEALPACLENSLPLAGGGPGRESNMLILIVPRHPQRFDAVAALLEKHAIPYARRSANQPVPPDARVVLGDSMGEMFAYYAASDVAFIGGSLLPLGGQNLIEACAVGVPVLVGPHTFNFQEAAEQAVACGAARRVISAEDALRQAATLLADPAVRQDMGEAGRAFAAAHRGATARTMEIAGGFLQ